MLLSNRQIVKTATIPRPISHVWAQWTTHEGLKTFLGKDNHITLELLGAFEIYFLTDYPLGLRGSEGCQVLSFVPHKMFSFSWSVPPSFPDLRATGQQSYVVVFFNASPDDRQTEISLHHLGWHNDAAWLPVIAYFEAAWDIVLNNLDNNAYAP